MEDRYIITRTNWNHLRKSFKVERFHLTSKSRQGTLRSNDTWVGQQELYFS